MKVHPAANLFPMMPDDELQELARDIAANGLIHPIIIDDQKQLIDGRNRMAACKIANVEPRFEQLNGHDALAYIVSANLQRRNLTKGQQAMLLAMIYPEGQHGRGKNAEARKAVVSAGFSVERLKQARSVLRHSQALAEGVIKRMISLDEALETVKEAQIQASSAEARLTRLQAKAPDLAARVAEETLGLDEGILILDRREIDLRLAKEHGREAAKDLLTFVGHVGTIISGIDAGEHIVIPAETIKSIRDALLLLEKVMRGERP